VKFCFLKTSRTVSKVHAAKQSKLLSKALLMNALSYSSDPKYAIIKRKHNSRKRKREAMYDKEHKHNLLNGHVLKVKQKGSKVR